MNQPIIASYGGGVNSCAMLIEMHHRGIIPDLILFSDTGGEKPETYMHLDEMDVWLESHGMPTITRVSVADNPNAVSKSLEDQCLRLGFLPSIAYGWKKCSQRWKADPIRKYLNNWDGAKAAWDTGLKLKHAIGYDAGEPHRNLEDDAKTEWWFPLREWGWSRAECVACIKAAGISVPGKSACFFCPSSKKHEILALKRDHPDLFERAIQIERTAAKNSTSVKGLGRDWSWESLVAADEAQLRLFPERIETPCGCYDGEEEEATPGTPEARGEKHG